MSRPTRCGISFLKVTFRGFKRHLAAFFAIFLCLYSLFYITQYSFPGSPNVGASRRSPRKDVLHYDVTKPPYRITAIPTWGNVTGLKEDIQPKLLAHFTELKRRGSRTKFVLPWLKSDVKPSPCEVPVLHTTARATLIVNLHGSRIDESLTSLFSIVKQTNITLVEDVILIGDMGLPAFYRDIYDLFPEYLPTFRFFNTPKRSTVTQARIKAAKFAHGEVLVFLDSLVQVTSHWLDHLIAAILKNPKSIVQPLIIRNEADLDGTGLPAFVYKQELQFDLNVREIKTPISPHYFKETENESVLNSAVFAMTKKAYQDIRELEEFSGFLDLETIVFSMKSWLCGGGIVSTPCSLVYLQHHSTSIILNTSVTQNKQTVNKNLEVKHKRSLLFISSVWFSPYDGVYKCLLPKSRNVRLTYTEKRAIKYSKLFYSRLKCKGFLSYVKMAQPNLFKPLSNSTFHGTLTLQGHDLYLSRSSSGSGLVFVSYLPFNAHPFTYANSSIIVNNMCITYSPNTKLVLSHCDPRMATQKWNFRNGQFQLKKNPHLCIVKTGESNIPAVSLCTSEKILSIFNFSLSFENNCIK